MTVPILTSKATGATGLASAGLALLLVACTSLAPRPPLAAGTSPALPAGTAATGSGPPAPVTVGAPAQVVERQTGTVRLAIRWPQRRTTQAIPGRTNSLKIRLLNSLGEIQVLNLAGETALLVVRPANEASVSTASVTVPVDSDYVVAVDAYREQLPAFDSVAIASGSATGLTVQPSRFVDARVVLVPIDSPEILTMSAGNGSPGTFITLTGKNFDGWNSGVTVSFGGVESPSVNGSSTLLEARIPDGASDGPVTVTADGITAASSESFLVISSLEVQGATESAVGSPVGFDAIGISASGSPILDPSVVWQVFFIEPDTPPDLASPPPEPDPDATPPPEASPSVITQDGVLTPWSTGSFEIQAAAGSLLATATININ